MSWRRWRIGSITAKVYKRGADDMKRILWSLIMSNTSAKKTRRWPSKATLEVYAQRHPRWTALQPRRRLGGDDPSSSQPPPLSIFARSVARFPISAAGLWRTTPFIVVTVPRYVCYSRHNYCTLYVEICMSYISDAVDVMIGKQEGQPITLKNSKVRVISHRNLCRKESGASPDKRKVKGYHRRGMRTSGLLGTRINIMALRGRAVSPGFLNAVAALGHH